MKFKKGQVPWNLGKHHSEETKRKIGIKSSKKIISQQHKQKISGSKTELI